MCVKRDRLGALLLGVGIGLLASLALCGWFWRVLLAAVLLVLGFMLLN